MLAGESPRLRFMDAAVLEVSNQNDALCTCIATDLEHAVQHFGKLSEDGSLLIEYVVCGMRTSRQRPSLHFQRHVLQLPISSSKPGKAIPECSDAVSGWLTDSKEAQFAHMLSFLSPTSAYKLFPSNFRTKHF